MEQKEDLNAEIATQIKNKSRLSFFTRLAAGFGYVPNKNEDDTTAVKLIPKPKKDQLLGDQPDVLDTIGHYVDLTQPEAIKKLYEEWEQDTQNTYDNISERMDRLDALLFMNDNYTKISAAVEETANEVALVTNDCVFQVASADPSWDAVTNKLINETWEFDADKIKDIAIDLTLFGEAIEGNEVNAGGIVKKNLLRPTEIQEKLVFNPVEVVNFNHMKKSEGRSTGFSISLSGMGTSYSSINTNYVPADKSVNYCSRSELLSNYLDHLQDVALNEMFTEHLIGYRWMDDQLLAPWQVTHYVVNERSSEFKPYGRPPLLSCLPFFKAYQRASGISDIRNRLTLPFTIYEVNTQGTNPLRAASLIRKAKQQFLSTSMDYEGNTIDGPSVCTSYWTSKDFITVTRDQGTNPNTEGNIDEKKHLDDQITLCTLVPPTYINPSADGYQLSGKALIELSAPFRSLVSNYRNIIINKVKEDIVLHYAIKGQDCPDFTIRMNVKTGAAAEDIESQVQSADAVLDVVSKILQCPVEEMPEDIVKDVYTKYTSIPITDVQNYKKTLVRQGKRKQDEEQLTQDDVNADASDMFGGPDMGGGGFEEPTGPEESTPTEESIKKRTKVLVEQRYKAYSPDLLYLLTEQLGTIKTPTYVATHFKKPIVEYAEWLRGTSKNERKLHEACLKADARVLKLTRKKELLG